MSVKRKYQLPIRFRQRMADYCCDGAVSEIFEDHAMGDVVSDIVEELQTSKPATIVQTLWVINDCAVFSHPRQSEFRRGLSASSPFWEAMHSLLYASAPMVRSNAISTIGKLSYPKRASLLRQAFPWFLENDPINLDGLVFEWRWLTGKWPTNWIEQIAKSPHFVVRWTLCDIGRQAHENSPEAQQMDVVYAMLARDKRPWVAAEAAYRQEAVKAEKLFQQEPQHLAPPIDQTWGFFRTRFNFIPRRKGSRAAFERFVRTYRH